MAVLEDDDEEEGLKIHEDLQVQESALWLDRDEEESLRNGYSEGPDRAERDLW